MSETVSRAAGSNSKPGSIASFAGAAIGSPATPPSGNWPMATLSTSARLAIASFALAKSAAATCVSASAAKPFMPPMPASIAMMPSAAAIAPLSPRCWPLPVGLKLSRPPSWNVSSLSLVAACRVAADMLMPPWLIASKVMSSSLATVSPSASTSSIGTVISTGSLVMTAAPSPVMVNSDPATYSVCKVV